MDRPAIPEKNRRFPVAYLELMRLHRRTGIWLLLWPCWWSIALASRDIRDETGLLALFFAGAVIMRSAGCVINDIFDRDIDRQVRRTGNRPLASGALTVKQALVLLAILLICGAGILPALDRLTVMLGCIFALMAAVYPLMKRIMPVPQLFLGMTINAGALAGWSAVTGTLSVSAWMLYAACIFWTLGYDTIYACQDRDDDSRIGIGSTALVFGEKIRGNVTACYVLAGVFLFLAGIVDGRSWLFYAGAACSTAHLLWQIRTLDPDSGSSCMNRFRSNAGFGWIMFLAVIADSMIRL